MGEILVKVRQEITECAHNNVDMMTSIEIQKLLEFNQKNQGNLESINKLAQEQATDLVSESDGFESICGDSVCESFDGSDSDEEMKFEPVESLDSDGFEEVVQKKRK